MRQRRRKRDRRRGIRDKGEKDNRRRGKRDINEGFIRYRDREGEKKKRGVRGVNG